MREKIAEIVDKIDIVCGFEGEDSLCRESISCNACITDRLEALFAAETAAMRESLHEARPTLLHFWQQADKNEKKAIDSMVAKIDTALKGGR